MRDKLIIAGAIVLIMAGVYRAGYVSARAHYQQAAVEQALEITEALWQARELAREAAAFVVEQEKLDDQKLKEIEDEAARDGTHCIVPVERLRGLDSIN